MFASTLVGNLTADPVLRRAGDVPVVNFDVATNHGYFDRAAGEWKETGTTYARVTAWRALAEHIAATLTKGSEVIVLGDLEQQTYEVDGVKRYSFVVTARHVGVSLRYQVAAVERLRRGDASAPFVAPAELTAATGGTPF